jgi:hypothetical protein
VIAHRPFANPPCNPVARKTLPRPPHPHPASVTIAIRPSGGVGCESCRFDLGQVATNIFRKIRKKRLDSPADKAPDGQITTRRRKQIPLVSRTRAACSRRCQRVAQIRARWQAPHRPVTLLRRAGTYIDTSQVGPGSAGRDTPALPKKRSAFPPGQSGGHILVLSSSHFDPKLTLTMPSLPKYSVRHEESVCNSRAAHS